MYITLKEYLNELAAFERRRPQEERRHIPTLEELAEVAGIHPVTLSRIVNNQTRRLSLEVPEAIIGYMRGLGYDMGTTDFIEYRASRVAGNGGEV